MHNIFILNYSTFESVSFMITRSFSRLAFLITILLNTHNLKKGKNVKNVLLKKYPSVPSSYQILVHPR